MPEASESCLQLPLRASRRSRTSASSGLFMAQSIAKLCAVRKQHFAHLPTQSIAMSTKTLNQRLADNLLRLMRAKGLSQNALGKKAKISPRALANYVDPAPLPTSKGRERSANLAHVDALAAALEVNPYALLADQAESDAQAQQILQAVMGAMSKPAPDQPSQEASAAPHATPRKLQVNAK